MKRFNMKKLAATSIAAISMFAAASVSQAATIAQSVDINVDLTASCTVVGAPIANPLLDFGVYTAFVGAATPAPTANFQMDCTRSLAAPTFDFGASNPDYGVLAGLNYSVSASSVVSTAGTAATAVLGGVGTADRYTITLTGGMAGGQAGDCAGGTQTACAGVQTATRTLTVTY